MNKLPPKNPEQLPFTKNLHPKGLEKLLILKELRGLSFGVIGKALGFTGGNYISMILRGKYNLKSYSTRKKICDFFGVNVEDIFQNGGK